MAILIPESLPSDASAGERAVFELLAKLDDDCIVYYEAMLRTGRPDFVVIMPRVGVLIIEVKGGYASQIREIGNERIIWNRDGDDRPEEHPLKQARCYMFGLIDDCKAQKWAAPLLQATGKYRRQLRFPIGLLAVFSNIQRHQLDQLGSQATRVFPPQTCLTRDVLEQWRRRDHDGLMQDFQNRFEPWWPIEPLSTSDVDILRAVIHPEIVISGRGTDIAVLDLRQERQARTIPGGHRILSGIAGSGKTVILVARAKFLALEANKRVLVLCHNKPLQLHLKDCLRNVSGTEVQTFHGWATKNNRKYIPNDDGAGETLCKHLESGGGDAGKFDAVLIDEGQDFLKSWFQAAKLALADPENGDFLIAGDGAQQVRPRDLKTWREAGISARGRVIRKKLDLDRNYRNTREILALAAPFAERLSRSSDDDPESAVFLSAPVGSEMAIRSGPPPEVVKLRNLDEECEYAATRIKCWLLGGMANGGTRSKVAPADIGVIFPYSCGRLEDLLFKELTRVAPVVDLRESALSDDVLSRDGIRLCRIGRVKGLQFKIVVFMAADMLPANFRDRAADEDRAQFYVALTRAEDLLVVTYSRDTGFAAELNRIKARGPH
jgi:hypothetical protein